MGFGLPQAIFLFLSFTIISGQHNTFKCQENYFVKSAYSDALGGCWEDPCPDKCSATKMGWLNKNSEPIKDEATLAANLKSSIIRDMDIARKYAQGYFKADCPRLLANGKKDCESYEYFKVCALYAGCDFALDSRSTNLTKYSDVQYWIDRKNQPIA